MLRADLCLDFVNTRYWRGQAEPTETLNTPEDFAGWMANLVFLTFGFYLLLKVRY